VIRAAVVEPKVTRVGMTTRLDKVLTHPIRGTLTLIAILGVVFWLNYQGGSSIQARLSHKDQSVSNLSMTNSFTVVGKSAPFRGQEIPRVVVRVKLEQNHAMRLVIAHFAVRFDCSPTA